MTVDGGRGSRTGEKKNKSKSDVTPKIHELASPGSLLLAIFL